jgi:alkyl sulfatase BDS1-like metallo-beta-lactamase superfamily hydrolase
MHVYNTSVKHRLVENTAWLPSRPAERVNDHIWLSRSNSYPYLIASPDGDVVINTGTAAQGARHRERFEQALGRPLDIRAIIITQSHHDHLSGWSVFNSPSVQTIVAANYEKNLAERMRLAPYFNGRRTAQMFHRKVVPGEAVTASNFGTPIGGLPLPVPTVRVHEPYRFEVGGRVIEVRRAPGGESLDGLIVWLPGEATVFCGNLMGAIYGALPHLSTIRGDRPRSAMLFVECIERLLALEPELLLTGHDHPVHGRDRIRQDLGKIADAVRYIYDWTLDGMAAGKSLESLMADIQLPPDLKPNNGRAPVSWQVRAVWEEYAGWYRADSVTGLYPVPQRTIWPEIIALAGGPDVLVERAAARLAAQKPVQALHFTDMVLAQQPDHRGALEVEIGAMQLLYERDGCEAYDLSRFLELEIHRAQQSRTSG